MPGASVPRSSREARPGLSPNGGAHSLGVDVPMKVQGWSSADWRGGGAQTEPPGLSLVQDTDGGCLGQGGLASGRGLRAPLLSGIGPRPQKKINLL